MTFIRRLVQIMLGYVLLSLGLFYGLFRLVVEAQVRADEDYERELLKGRDWDE